MIRADRLAKGASAREQSFPATPDKPARRPGLGAGRASRPTGFEALYCSRTRDRIRPQARCGLPPRPDNQLREWPPRATPAPTGATRVLMGSLIVRIYRCPFSRSSFRPLADTSSLRHEEEADSVD